MVKINSLLNNRVMKGEELESFAFDSPLLSYTEFKRILGQEIKRSERYCEYLSLLIIDFSSLIGGHPLSQRERVRITFRVGERIKESIRETDFVCPLGDGKLALILAGTSKEGAEYLAAKLEEGIPPLIPWDVEEEDRRITTRVISYPEAGNGKQNLLKFINSYLLLG